MRVCVADDHDAIREALRELLSTGLGVEEVVEARTGEEALAAVRADTADLVLMDVNMPGLNGVTATREVRQQHPRVRVVALTAAQDPESIAAMIAAGADSYLVKTSSPQELRDSLREILAGGVVLAPEVLPVVVEDLARRLRSEQERADSLVALDRTKREFIALVSDQLSNPLAAITGYVKTLCSGWERLSDDVKREFLQRISQQSAELERRIAQILTVTRLQAERGGGGPFALDAAVREVLDGTQELRPGRVVATDLDAVQVSGDRRAITEVVLALVDNACVHTAGMVRITLRVAGGDAVLEVADDGPGVEPQVLNASIEQPFLPGDTSDTRPAGGMGLSLYIAHRVVAGNGGRLEFETGPDSGTVARMRLPATSVG